MLKKESKNGPNHVQLNASHEYEETATLTPHLFLIFPLYELTKDLSTISQQLELVSLMIYFRHLTSVKLKRN